MLIVLLYVTDILDMRSKVINAHTYTHTYVYMLKTSAEVGALINYKCVKIIKAKLLSNFIFYVYIITLNMNVS